MTYFLFFLGFIFLLKGADFLVDGSSSLAKKLNVPDIVVGLTIVALGTSAPELFVNILSSLDGNAGIGIGNIFGSNIANILLILGISAMIFPLPVQRNTVLSEIPFSLTATLLVGFVANAALFSDISLSEFSINPVLYINRWEGLILLLFFLLFMAYILKITKEQADKEKIDEIMGRVEKPADNTYPEFPVSKSTIYIILGITGLFLGGKWVVEGAVLIARHFDFSESFIGLTIVAVGTSLPELVTAATAAFRHKTDIAVGTVVGSNIFNLLWILGISAMIKPLPFDVISNTDILIIVLSSALLILTMAIGKKYVIERWNGALFLLGYVAYIVFLFNRG